VYGTNAPVYSPAVTGTHCACPERDGQAEYWMAGSATRCFTWPKMLTYHTIPSGPPWLRSAMNDAKANYDGPVHKPCRNGKEG